jgi:hypothetical protein
LRSLAEANPRVPRRSAGHRRLAAVLTIAGGQGPAKAPCPPAAVLRGRRPRGRRPGLRCRPPCKRRARTSASRSSGELLRKAGPSWAGLDPELRRNIPGMADSRGRRLLPGRKGLAARGSPRGPGSAQEVGYRQLEPELETAADGSAARAGKAAAANPETALIRDSAKRLRFPRTPGTGNG